MCLAYFAATAFYVVFASTRLTSEEHSKLGELFVGLKLSKKARAYVILLNARRLLFVTVLVVLNFSAIRTITEISIIVMGLIQMIYAVSLVIIRPFAWFKDSMIELTNEVFFSLFLFSLMYFNTEGRWTDFATHIYLWMLSANNIIVCLILFVSFVRAIFVKCRGTKNSECRTAPRKSQYASTQQVSVLVEESKVTTTLRLNKHNKPLEISEFE
mmetsp:Transcript_35/g.34  ORF Transcript_35/g.34 Transcript_35/m.34 type:complete len:214 (+) Transcript_35:1734-2375(+)